jgi:hypothetical protein
VRLAALVGYVFLALAFTWPLVLHLDTHLTGPVGGDTGVYVWNQWVFRHEILNERLPLFTREIFSLSRPANLSLHNYTIFQDLLALPLLGRLGVVTTFNVVYLMMIVITGYATFRLAFHVTRRPFESWLAGALFSWSPYLVTRGMGHFSLVAAAPLPVFALLLLDREGRASVRNAVALGATVCWAGDDRSLLRGVLRHARLRLRRLAGHPHHPRSVAAHAPCRAPSTSCSPAWRASPFHSS